MNKGSQIRTKTHETSKAETSSTLIKAACFPKVEELEAKKAETEKEPKKKWDTFTCRHMKCSPNVGPKVTKPSDLSKTAAYSFCNSGPAFLPFA